MNVIRPDVSVAVTASGKRRSVKRARSALRLRSHSQSAMKEAKSIWRSLASTGAASRKCTSMNSPSLSAMRCWLLWMIAVCGIGNPNGLRNSATTAYQSANPPMVAASANAATKPKIGCIGRHGFGGKKSASVTASTSVASALTRRTSAAPAASPVASNENVLPVEVMAAFWADRGSRWPEDSSFRHCERSDAIHSDVGEADCIASSLALRNDGGCNNGTAHQKEGPPEAGLRIFKLVN